MVQPDSAINMLQIVYLWMPMVINVVILFLLSKLKVEQANQTLRAEKAAKHR